MATAVPLPDSSGFPGEGLRMVTMRGVTTSTIVPLMTSATTPSGVSSTSSTYSGSTNYGAFSRSTDQTTGAWLNNGVALPQWIQYQFASPKVVLGYSFFPWDLDNFPGRCPNTWNFQGSMDGSNWTTLHTVTGASWAVGVGQSWSFVNNTAYLYYRIYITANGGNTYTGLRLISLYGETNTPGIVVPSGELFQLALVST